MYKEINSTCEWTSVYNFICHYIKKAIYKLLTMQPWLDRRCWNRWWKGWDGSAIFFLDLKACSCVGSFTPVFLHAVLMMVCRCHVWQMNVQLLKSLTAISNGSVGISSTVGPLSKALNFQLVWQHTVLTLKMFLLKCRKCKCIEITILFTAN